MPAWTSTSSGAEIAYLIGPLGGRLATIGKVAAVRNAGAKRHGRRSRFCLSGGRRLGRPDRKAANMGEHELSLEAIDHGRLGIERLICYVDFAMVLNVEFDGQPENAQVSLVEQPKRYETQLIDAYLAEHGDEMSIRHLRCPDCGYLTINSRETTCQNCDSPLEAIRDTSEMWLRDSARKRLMWEVPGFQAVSSVPGDLVSQVHPSGATMLSDLLLPLSTVFQQLLVSMGHTKSRYVRECWSHLCLGKSVREMLPCGDTIEQKHRHYLVVREKLTSGYNMLTGFALQYPEFKDGYDVAGLRRFPPAVTPDRRAVFGPVMPPVARDPSQDVLAETAVSNIAAKPARLPTAPDTQAQPSEDDDAPPEQQLTLQEYERLLEIKKEIDPCNEYIGQSVAILRVFEQIERLNKGSRAEKPVLICGPSGSGKSRIAKLIHSSSSRKNGPFLRVSATGTLDDLTAMKGEWFGVGKNHGLHEYGPQRERGVHPEM